MIAAALSTFVPVEGGHAAPAPAGALQPAGKAKPPVRRIHKIARPLQSAAEGANNSLPELLHMRMELSARMSYDALLQDGAAADWCADSHDFANGTDSFSDWAVAAADELQAREAARAAQGARGVTWRPHVRALTFPIAVGPTILGYLMVLTEEHLRCGFAAVVAPTRSTRAMLPLPAGLSSPNIF